MKLGYKILWLLISIGLIIASYNDLSMETRHCGKIIKIIPEQSVGGGRRGGGYVERMILIKFNDVGVKAINLDADSYYTASLGQNVCVKLDKSQLKTQSIFWFVMFFISCLSGLIASIILINYLIEY